MQIKNRNRNRLQLRPSCGPGHIPGLERLGLAPRKDAGMNASAEVRPPETGWCPGLRAAHSVH
jgi:hypothetical protein